MRLPAAEFIRRFLLHVVPDRFVRIRHFGLLANRARQATLARCRALLNQPPPPPAVPESVPALVLRLTGFDLERCQVCPEGRMRRTEGLLPTPRVHPGHVVTPRMGRPHPADRGPARATAHGSSAHAPRSAPCRPALPTVDRLATVGAALAPVPPALRPALSAALSARSTAR